MNRHFIGFISIHAPRTGSDVGARVKRDFTAISIHAPRTGSDRRKAMYNIIVYEFQSTLPARGATASKRYPQRNRGDFNPRSPHGERRLVNLQAPDSRAFQSTLPARGATSYRCCFARAHRISIHAPRTGSDIARQLVREPLKISIHAPRTGSDDAVRRKRLGIHISIHAPRTGSDSRRKRTMVATENFNPRSPHGERPAPFRRS